MKLSGLLLLLPFMFSVALGHVVQTNPKPYKFLEYGPSNPLEPSGSNYPCKIPGGLAKLEIDGAPTPMKHGENQTLAFTGQAVHGGGSCQLAVTPGFEPNKNSQWTVIHSIEGGCPKANNPGNLNGGNPDKFQYQIPKEVAPGKYSQAWTWFSKTTGEVYMNCAPIVVDGKDEDGSEPQGLPGLFLASLGSASNGCELGQNKVQQLDIAFPNPGPYVTRPEGDARLLKPECDGNPKNKGAGSGKNPSSPASQPAGSAAPTSAATSAPSASASAPASAPSSSASPSAPAASPPAPAASDPPAAPSASASPSAPEASPSAPAAASPSAAPSAPAAPSGACTEGAQRCNDDKVSMSICTGGNWIAPIPLGTGSECKPGVGPIQYTKIPGVPAFRGRTRR